MIWAIVQLSTKETQFFCVMKVIDGAVLPEFPNRRVWVDPYQLQIEQIPKILVNQS